MAKTPVRRVTIRMRIDLPLSVESVVGDPENLEEVAGAETLIQARATMSAEEFVYEACTDCDAEDFLNYNSFEVLTDERLEVEG